MTTDKLLKSMGNEALQAAWDRAIKSQTKAIKTKRWSEAARLTDVLNSIRLELQSRG